jgi:hypothetical protein
LPDGIGWLDPKDFTQKNVQQWSEFFKNSAAPTTFEEAVKPKMFVYRQNDLIGLRDEIREFWRAVFLFQIHLRIPNEEQFLRLYDVPPIQQALSRLREGS